MAYVIAEACVSVKDRACVEVCPVDGIHPRKDEEADEPQLYINPGDCIDCGACEPVCPVKAIYAEDDLPEQSKEFLQMNADYYALGRDDFRAKWGRPA